MSYAVDIRHAPDAAGGSLEEAVAALRARAPDSGVGFTERLEALDRLAKGILEPSSVIRRQVPAQGLAYLATFLQKCQLEGLIRRELADPRSLSEFVSVGSRKSIRHVPRGLVCHWVAGNVPLLALFSWAVSVVLGNRNLVRLSSRQEDVVSPFLEALAGGSEAGAGIARETVVVSFPTDHADAHRIMSEAADVRIAWGGREAVTAVRSLPVPWECEDIVFGPRASLAVIDPAAIDPKGIGRLAVDTAVFDQLACSSPQCIFVRAGRDSERFKRFRDDFSRAFADAANNYPRHPLDFSETYTIGLDRARALLEGGEIARDDGTSWTVAVLDTPNDSVQCANRFVQLIPFESFSEVYPLIPLNVQTVVTQLAADDLAEFTEQAAHFGVCRFPKPGEGNNFENPWDGVGLVSRLCRSVLRTDAI